jgi:hypothetical protein
MSASAPASNASSEAIVVDRLLPTWIPQLVDRLRAYG